MAATAFDFAGQSLAAGLYTDRKPFLSFRFKTDKIKYAHPKFKRPLILSIACSSTSPPKPIQQDSPNPKQFKLPGSIAKTATLCALLSLSLELLASEISPLSLKFAPIDNKAGLARLVEIYRRVLVIGFSLSWFLPVRHDLSKLIANCSSTSPPIPTKIPPTLCAHALSLSRLLSLKLAPILPNPNTLFFAALSAAVVYSSTGAPIAVTAAGLAWLGIYSCALLIRAFLSWLARMLELLGMYWFWFTFQFIALSLPSLAAYIITCLRLKLAPLLPNPNTLFFAAISAAVVRSSTGAPIAVTVAALAWLGIYTCGFLIGILRSWYPNELANTLSTVVRLLLSVLRDFLSWLARMLELLGMYRFTFQFSHIGQQRISAPSLALQLIAGFLRLIGWLQTNDVKKVSRFQVMKEERELKVKLVGCIGGEELVFEFEVQWEERELKVKLVGGIGGEKLVLETGLKCVGRTLPNGSSEN